MTDNLKYIKNWETFFPAVHLQIYSQCFHTMPKPLHIYDTRPYSIHKILSQRPPVGSKYISVWLYLVNSMLPKLVCFLDMMDNSICDALELHIRHDLTTWKGHHLFSIPRLLLHHSTVVYKGLNAPYGPYLHEFTCWRICKSSQNYIIRLQSVKFIQPNL